MFLVSHSHTLRIKPLGLALLTGTLTGIIVAYFRLALSQINHLLQSLLVQSSQHFFQGLLFLGLLLILGIFTGYCLKAESNISGSGIPQVSGQLQGQLQQNWWRVLIYKFLGGLATIGSGLTLGREGPSVQIGASIGQGMAQLSRSKEEVSNYLIAGAAGAGMAAAFNAPLSGLFFVIEELLHQSNRRLFVYTGITIASSSLTAKYILGNQVSIPIPVFNPDNFPNLIQCLLLGILVAFSGLLFNQGILSLKNIFSNWQAPLYLKTALPFLITGLFLLYDPQLFGSGANLIQLPFESSLTLPNLSYLYLVKLVLLLLAFCSGIPGGIFFPLLALGSLVGQIYGLTLAQLGLASADLIPYFSIIAMACHFAAIVRAPLTGMVLIMEMTGASLPWLLPMMIACYTADLVSEFLGNQPIYESLLEIILQNKYKPTN